MSEALNALPAPNLIKAARNFNRIAGRAIDKFDPKDAGFQMGMVLEEAAEGVRAIMFGCVSNDAINDLGRLAELMERHAQQFKENQHYGDVLRSNRVELLDSFIDVAWVSTGGAYAVSHNTAGAMAHVIEKNMAKFPGDVVTHNETTGKIMKPIGWTPPDLTPFVTLATE